jgi:hypothetical protein
MAVIRLTLLVILLGGLTILLVQNWSPVLPLVFLGMRTQPLPLALWILFTTAAGAGTSLLINVLFKLSNYFGRQPQPAPAKSTTRRTTATRKQDYTPPPPSQAPPKTKYATSNEFDDWETDNSGDDWDFEQQPREAANPQPPADASSYERPQKPKSGSQSGSTYSYSYREPKNTAVGKTESVYDADYRVIIPPYQPTANEVVNDDENDWGIFEDDDFEDDKPSRK